MEKKDSFQIATTIADCFLDSILNIDLENNISFVVFIRTILMPLKVYNLSSKQNAESAFISVEIVEFMKGTNPPLSPDKISLHEASLSPKSSLHEMFTPASRRASTIAFIIITHLLLIMRLPSNTIKASATFSCYEIAYEYFLDGYQSHGCISVLWQYWHVPRGPELIVDRLHLRGDL